MSNRLRMLLGNAPMRKAGTVILFALACSFGCGCLADDGAEHDDVDDNPALDDAAQPVDGEESLVDTGEIDLGTKLAMLEAQYQQTLDQNGESNFAPASDDDDDDGRSSNPEPTPWEFGAADNPEPTPWHDGAENAVNPEPTPWLDREDDDDGELKTDASFSANSTGGTGSGYGMD